MQLLTRGCHHSPVDSSTPTIQPPRVRVPSTPSTLLSFIVFVPYLSCEKNENQAKEAGFGPFKKTFLIRNGPAYSVFQIFSQIIFVHCVMLLQELEIIFSFDALDNTRLGKDALARVNVFAIADVKSNVFEIVF